MFDPRKLRPCDLCQLLNSTPLGPVIRSRWLHEHRTQAGYRIGDSRRVNLVCYVAWLVQKRHGIKQSTSLEDTKAMELVEAAEVAAELANYVEEVKGHGQKLNQKQEALIAAMLTEPTHRKAAQKVGVCESTIYRWLHLPGFRAAYRQARRELVEAAVGRMQAATGQAVDTLLTVARQGRRESDRVRAATALLDHALRGISLADQLHGQEPTNDNVALGPNDVVQVLGGRLRQLSASELPTAEKARLTALLADALLRAIGVDVLDKRLEALQGVLQIRKEQELDHEKQQHY